MGIQSEKKFTIDTPVTSESENNPAAPTTPQPEKIAVVSEETAAAAISNPFTPENLFIEQDFAKSAPVKKLITQIPVRRPSKQEFVRVHHDPAYRRAIWVVEMKKTGEEFLVLQPLVEELRTRGEIVPKIYALAINTVGTLFFWPMRLQGDEDHDNDWWKSNRLAGDYATRQWIRTRANRDKGGYDIAVAEAQLPDPDWPDMSYLELLDIACRDRVIDSFDHVVLKRLRGLI